MSLLLKKLGIEVPVIQAGMGGGLSDHRLAAAVSAAGGLGTIGIMAPEALRNEIEGARRLTAKPIAVNLLLPFARSGHWDAGLEADVVVTFWGHPRRRTPGVWIHQCGSLDEALEARAAGADALIAQGVEAGGHVRGAARAPDLLASIRASVGPDYPLLSAGGIVDAADVRTRLEGGADAVVCGTRFLASSESAAHPEYKRRLLESSETILTELFGAGWPAPHRVVPNEATRRWLRSGPRGPAWLRAFHRASAPALSRIPISLQSRLAAAQTPGRPLFGPTAATADGPANLVEAGPLYAGESVARIHDVRPAAELVVELAQGA